MKRTYLREWRKSHDMTLVEVGEAVGMTNQNYGKIERALVPYSQALLEKLAELYGCSEVDLIGRPPEAPPLAKLPTEDELASMLAEAQKEVPEETTIGGYPKAVAASLRARLERYSSVRPNDGGSASEPSKNPGAGARSRPPTKKSARG